MENPVLILFIIFFSGGHSFAQFFEKADADFKFNGTDLGALNYDQTKNCILIKETESYRRVTNQPVKTFSL
jgi:hypothetical protein